MVSVEMMAVGRELLIGRTLNTNAHWVGKRLARLGSMLKRVSTVDDDLGEIGIALRESLRRRPDFLVVVGGLGPTPDDMTLRGIGEGLGLRMRLDKTAVAMIKAHYVGRGLGEVEMTKARKKMATLPSSGRPVANPVGTAPAVRLQEKSTVIFCLPGVPTEMKRIFVDSVEPEVKAKLGKLFRAASTHRLEGMLESVLAPLIAKELALHPGAYIKSHPKGVEDGVSRIDLDIAAVSPRKGDAEEETRTIFREMGSAMQKSGVRVMGPRRRA